MIKYADGLIDTIWRPHKKISNRAKVAENLDLADDFPDDVTFDPDCVYTMTRAVSARVNDNKDAFPRHELRGEINGLPFGNDYFGFRTFAPRNGKCARSHVDHYNTPELAEQDPRHEPRGSIIHSWYHEDRMGEVPRIGRAEDPVYKEAGYDAWTRCLVKNSRTTWPVLCEAIESGLVNKVSMGCELGYSTCSCCGLQAADFTQLCDHVGPLSRGQVFAAKEGSPFVKSGLIEIGEPVPSFEICSQLQFFELSWILDVQADPTAVTLDRIEGENGQSLREILLAGSETSSPELKESIQKAAQFHKQKRAVEEEEPVDTESVEDKVQNTVNFTVKNQDSLNEDSEESSGDDQGFDYNSTPDQQEGEFYPQYPFPCSALKSASEANPDDNLDITIDAEKCVGCIYNASDRVGAVDCRFPKIIRPGGSDPLPVGFSAPEDIDPTYNSSGFLNEDGSLIEDFPNLKHPPNRGRTSSLDNPVTDAEWEDE